MKYFSVAVGMLAFVTGALAAWYWYRASAKIAGIFEWNGVDTEYVAGMVAGDLAKVAMELNRSSALNRRAAIWTGATAFLGGASALAGAWPL